MSWIATDRLAEEARSTLPLLKEDALVAAERVGVYAVFVDLRSSTEAPQGIGVILDVGIHVSTCDPCRGVIWRDGEEFLSEERKRSGLTKVPERRGVDGHTLETVRSTSAHLRKSVRCLRRWGRVSSWSSCGTRRDTRHTSAYCMASK
jgi:hypothetical protein